MSITSLIRELKEVSKVAKAMYKGDGLLNNIKRSYAPTSYYKKIAEQGHKVIGSEVVNVGTYIDDYVLTTIYNRGIASHDNVNYLRFNNTIILNSYALYRNDNLTHIDFAKGILLTIPTNAISKTTASRGALEELCIRTPDIVVTLQDPTTSLLNCIDVNTKIYVPDDLVDSYKATANWSIYKDCIYPLSDRTEEPCLELEEHL